MSSLSSLRILNLEDNRVEHVPTLTGLYSLGELNIRRNKVKYIHPNHHLVQLKRLLISENKISSFDDANNIFEIPNLAELNMVQNKIYDYDQYRLIVISRSKGLKLLDGRRVSEEERRMAAKLLKKETDKKKDEERRSLEVEERRKCMEQIQYLWREDKTGAVVNPRDVSNGKFLFWSIVFKIVKVLITRILIVFTRISTCEKCLRRTR